MVDSCNREIDYIRISLTDRCNLRCIYCMPEEGVKYLPHERIITYEEILRLCRCFAKLGIHKVKLTGGEPLVRKDVAYLAGELKRLDGIDNVTVTTNGILLKSQIGGLAAGGLDAVNISLDTLDPELFQRLTRFDRIHQVLEGIEAALSYPQIEVKINCVPIYGDDLERTVIQMAGLARKQKLHVRFIELMPIGIGKKLRGYEEERIKEILRRAYGPLRPYGGSLGNGPCVYYSLEGFLGKIGFVSAVSHKFCDRCNRVRLTSEGFLKTCLQYTEGTDLKTLMNQGMTDDALTKVIYETIQNKPWGHQFGEEDQDGSEEKRMSEIGG